MERLLRLDGRVWLAGLIGLGMLAGLAGEATAQTYPSRPVEIVVPFVAGGGTDLIARATADYLGKRWGQPVLVVNKPGGGGVIGARAPRSRSRGRTGTPC